MSVFLWGAQKMPKLRKKKYAQPHLLETAIRAPEASHWIDHLDNSKEINAIVANFCELNQTIMNIDEAFYDVFVRIMGKELIDRSALMTQAGKRCQHVCVYQRKLCTPFDVSGCHPTGGPGQWHTSSCHDT